MNEIIEEFLDTKSIERGVANNTIVAYRNDLEQFVKIILPQKVEDVTSKDVDAYIKQLNDLYYSPKSIARKMACIRELYKFLQSENIITENPTIGLRTPKIGKHLPLFLTKKEIEKLYKTAQKKGGITWLRMSIMIRLMYSSGLRVSELVSLPENAINYDLQQILIYGKGSKERVVPVSKVVLTEITDYLGCRNKFIGNRKNKWLFPSLRSLSGHMTRDAFFKNLKKLAILSGVDQEKVHPHILRHSFATLLVNKGADLRSIQKMLGHENVSTTEIYTHITTEKLTNEIRKYHPLANIEKK